jgi:suppressor of G2 allele of SKP1
LWLEEYETAKAAFVTGMGKAESPEIYRSWIRKCDAELEDDAEAGDTGVDMGAAIVADPPPQATSQPPKQTQEPVTSTPAAEAPTAPPAPKYRHQWFQSPAAVTLSIMAKGIKPDRATVDITPTAVHVHIKAAGAEELEYALDLELFGTVDPGASKVEFLTTKIEIRLPKADGAGNWQSLERSAEASAAAVYAATPSANLHPYPTSYSADRKQVKDWDKLETEVKEEEKEEKLDGDAALQKLFKDIYGNADEETRRAMNKSFVESNGTVLSTNWKDIGAKKVECTPPSGMEVKKYEL